MIIVVNKAYHIIKMYNEPLCIKCLHPINYPTEIKRCTIGTCLCVIHLQKPEDKK